MKRETKVLVVLYLLLVVALTVPFVPRPVGFYCVFSESRPLLTIIEYLRTIIWAMILRGIIA